MAGTRETPLLPVSGETGALIVPPGSADLVLNFRRTSEGTLAGVVGPCPLIPDYGNGLPTWGNPHGICHARLIGGKRDVTLIHAGGDIWAFDGPTRGRIRLVGAVGSGAMVEATLVDDTSARPPTQFLTTPQGIVIMPAESRPFFYDGERLDYLGYERGPDAPVAVGASIGADTSFTWLGNLLHADFGFGRKGTVSNDAGNNTRLRGAVQYVSRWVDTWGNWSPLSARSNSLSWVKLAPGIATDPAENFRVLAILSNISRGPGATVGRQLGVTKDLEHSGTNTLFVLPNSTGGNFTGAFATIPDNATTSMPDNAPDTWLSIPIEDSDPLPVVRFGRLAFGRAWYCPANDPGVLIGTRPGQWGTPEKNLRIKPDPSGGELTGAWGFGGALVVWTRTSTFIVSQFDGGGQGFRYDLLHPTVGCVGPSAMAAMDDGSLVWLSDDGFYRYDGKAVTIINRAQQPTIEGLNRSRLIQACAAFDPTSKEFRCWVPDGGSIENNLCIIFDSTDAGWRRRDGESLRSVCVTQDHRRYMLGAGWVTSLAGAWVIDHRNPYFTEPTRTYTVRTSWLVAHDRKSPMTAFIMGREGGTGTLTATMYRDYRWGAAQDNGKTFSMRQPDDTPPSWGTTAWGATTTSPTGTTVPVRLVRRRPIDPKIDTYVPGAFAYQLEITGTTPWEFSGIIFGENPLPGAGRIERAS